VNNQEKLRHIAILPYTHDDRLIEAVGREKIPHFTVYIHPTVAVVLGRGSNPEVELHVANVLQDGVQVLKRPGGGCAVVLDPGNVIVSVALPSPGIAGIRTAFRQTSDWVIAGLDALGVDDVRQRGVSDLAWGDRKIGGSCIYRTRGLLYYSTTLLLQPDLDLVIRYLQHPPREPAYRRGRGHREFLRPLSEMFAPCSTAAVVADLQAALAAGRLNDFVIHRLR
jgi:lipoate-protein ligase A